MKHAPLSKEEANAVIAAARDAIERLWSEWVDSGEAEELGVSQRKLSAAERGIRKLTAIKNEI